MGEKIRGEGGKRHVLPEIENRESLLDELYRVLKPNGYRSIHFCFRIKKGRILEIVEGSKLFFLREQKGYILNFSRKNKTTFCSREVVMFLPRL